MTIKILWSALSNYELGSALVKIRNLEMILCTVNWSHGAKLRQDKENKYDCIIENINFEMGMWIAVWLVLCCVIFFTAFLEGGHFILEVYQGHCISLCKVFFSPMDKNHRIESKNRETENCKKGLCKRPILKNIFSNSTFWLYGFCSNFYDFTPW